MFKNDCFDIIVNLNDKEILLEFIPKVIEEKYRNKWKNLDLRK